MSKIKEEPTREEVAAELVKALERTKEFRIEAIGICLDYNYYDSSDWTQFIVIERIKDARRS